MSYAKPSSRDDFEIVIICALPTEYNAVTLVFDQFWDDEGDAYGRAGGDHNHYTTGCIGKHNIVLALLPHMGKAGAASAASSLRSSYRALRLALLVGVCGGVPTAQSGEILLGDVIISSAIVQFDFGRQFPDQFIRKDTVQDNLSRPNKDIRGLLASIDTDRGLELLEERTADIIQQIQNKAGQKKQSVRDKYKYPGITKDKLFSNDYRHRHRNTACPVCDNCISNTDPVCGEAMVSSCDALNCGEDHLVVRARYKEKSQLEQDGNIAAQDPVLHVGLVASGDKVIKSARDRDTIAQQTKAIAFEMEGAGIWDEVPCIVVKGVCDYADCHKSKDWQNFAAATAASTAKALLERYTQTDKASGSANDSTRSGSLGGDTSSQSAWTPGRSTMPGFYGPIIGQNVIAGQSTTGGNITNNF